MLHANSQLSPEVAQPKRDRDAGRNDLQLGTQGTLSSDPQPTQTSLLHRSLTMVAQKYRGWAQALPNLDEFTSCRMRQPKSGLNDRPLVGYVRNAVAGRSRQGERNDFGGAGDTCGAL